MGSKVCWIDPDELAQLGAELGGGAVPSPPEGGAVPLDLFGDGVGDEIGDGVADTTAPSAGAMVAKAPDLERTGQRLAAIRRRADLGGLLRSSDGAGDAPRPLSAAVPGEGDSLVDRLESLVRWATGQSCLTGLFVADCGGNELIESGADPVLVASGVALADGWQRALGELESTVGNGVSTAASVRDGEGAVLTVFSCRSAYGQHVLGVLSPDLLAPEVAVGLRGGFGRVMGEPVDA